ncbi:MAG: Amuc_1100 family pilus-like protein [Verrucomicrobiota bacterium]|nr:Amuc_1100 family pilus-like protein [Verrucomicrobiota bacterium]MEC8333725.1 Amuc_1100 family pilus-like protein [Verrucomicrobiota bacterium]
MNFLKKNLFFSAGIIICFLSFSAGSFLALNESGSIAKAEQEMASAEARLKNLRLSDPAPSAENVDASSENVALLKSALETIREDLQRGNRLTTSRDGIAVMAGVQQFISTYQRMSTEQVDATNKPAPISLPQNFAFGFQEYIDEAKPLSDPERSAVLDQQRQILSYLMDKLIEAKPASIVSVQREFLEQEQGQQNKSFQISEAVSARVPGAIDTLAFQLSFTGFTDSLRTFLNNLAKFDLPIVVRSIDVQRPNKIKSSTAAATNNNLDSIFGVFGGSNDDEAPKEAQKPVISENISTFTIVVEFIEIIVSADSALDKA